MEPYLTGEPRALFDAWHEKLRARFTRDLTFPEIRRGVQALSSLYVARRGRLGEGGSSAFDGAGKRAGFALYFAPLHFLTVYHAAREIEFDALPFTRLWDLGCGTGAAGAAWGTAQRYSAALSPDAGSRPDGAGDRFPALKVIGVDHSGFALDEAAATYRAFGLRAETRRMDLGHGGGAPVARIGSVARPVVEDHRRGGRRPAADGALRGSDAVVLAFTLNEIAETGRERLLHHLTGGGGTSRPILIIEPVAKKVAPWWPHWERALDEDGISIHSLEWRKRIELPEWIAEMDRAAGLDHRELTARVLGAVG